MDTSTTDSQATRRYYVALLAIVAAGVLTRLFHFQLALGCDDQLWLITARALGEPSRPDIGAIFYARIFWRCVLALWGLPAALTLQSSAVLMFGLSCLAVVLIAETARIAFGRLAALLAAALYAFHPLNVVYDPKTLPDNLAVTMLAASVLLFCKYLQRRHWVCLVGAALLVGSSFSVKEYYILAAVPFGLCILGQKQSWGLRLRHACLFSACVLAGLSVDFLLHWWESGNPLAHFAAVSDYGERKDEVSSLDVQGIRRLHSLFWERLRYIEWLFVDGGILGGFAMLWGVALLIGKSRRCLTSRMLLGTAAVFFLFLIAMPTKLSPLTFVEMQPRYLPILFPMLAIGGGAALAMALSSLQDRAVRVSLIAAVVLAFGYGACVPNEMLDAYRVQEFVGIRKVLASAQQRGIVELVLPAKYDLYLPDRYDSYGVQFAFRDAEDAQWVEAAPGYLAARPGRAAFLPEVPFPRTDAYRKLRESLAADGFRVERVRVPGTSYRAWLYRFDLHDANDQLVGWICRPEESAMIRENDGRSSR